MKEMLRVVDGETEKFCRVCKEWWPADDEFFPRSPRDKSRFRSPCKCCIDERRRATNETKPCCVPGCNNPRYSWRYSRCWEHRYGQVVTKRRRLEAVLNP